MAAPSTAECPDPVAEESYDDQLEELQDWLSAQPPSRIISPFSRASTPYEPSMELRDMSHPPSQSQSPAGPSGAVPTEPAAALPTTTAPLSAPAATHRRSASMPAHSPTLLVPGALTLPPSISGALSTPSSPRTLARDQQERVAPAPHVQVVHHHHHHHHRDSSGAAKPAERVRAPRSSLARQSGRGRSLLVTLLCLGCHALFFYAQLTGRALDCPGSTAHPTPCAQQFAAAGVAQGLISFHVDYEAYGALAESIGIAEKLMCATDCPNPTVGVPDTSEAWSAPHFVPATRTPVPVDLNNISGFACAALRCDTCRSIFGVQTWQSCALDFEYTLLHMSYLYSVDELWSAKGPKAEDGTDTYPGRVAAALIFVFSFIWPHVKLLLLHLFFYASVTEPCRRNVNFWLAFGGKWSLTDVIVMCVIIALFNIPLAIPLQRLWGEFEGYISGECETYCEGLSIAPRINCTLVCDHLEAIASAHVLSPEELKGGAVSIDLRMRGLDAMYAFCVAVVLSLTVGILIEHLAERVKAKEAKAESAAKAALAPPDDGEGGEAEARHSEADVSGATLLAAEGHGSERSCARVEGEGGGGEGGQAAPYPYPARRAGSVLVLARRWARAARAWLRGVPGEREWCLGVQMCSRRGAVHIVHVLLVLVQLFVTIGAFTATIFLRQCVGALARGLREKGIDFDGAYNMLEMASLAAEGGGLNYLMAATFWVFVVIGPLSRSLTQLLLLVLPLSRPTQHRVHQLSRHVSAYYAYEVLLLAVPLINVAFGPVSSNLLKPRNFPWCNELMQVYPEETTCFQINVVPGTGYKFTIAVVVLFFFCGFDGSPTHKHIHRRLYPDDEPPPTCPTRRPKAAAAARGPMLPQPHRDYEAWRSRELSNAGQLQDI